MRNSNQKADPGRSFSYDLEMGNKWWILAAVACGTFMATLDSSIVNIALPTLTKELGADLTQIKWVVVVYLLVITCLLLPFGKISDQRGRKPIFQLGFFLFILSSCLCGLSPNLAGLIIFRALQGVGAAMLMANGPAVITTAFPSRERGAALGTLAMVVSVGLISGPSLGGMLITKLGWRSIFWVNVPIGLIGIFLAQVFVKPDEHVSAKPTFDWAGFVIQSAFLLAFIFFFDPPKIAVSGAAPVMIPRVLIGAAIILLAVVFFKVESTIDSPLFDLSLLKNRLFSTANIASFLVFVSLSSVTVLMPFFLEEVLRFEPGRTGFFMSAIPVTIFVVAPISGRLSDRFGSRWLSVTGCLVAAIALLGMGGRMSRGIHTGESVEFIIGWLALMGLAIGLFQSPNNSAIMGTVPSSKLGVASATLAMVRNLGLVTGTGLATTLFGWRYQMSGDFVVAFQTALTAGGAVALGATVACLGRGKSKER